MEKEGVLLTHVGERRYGEDPRAGVLLLVTVFPPAPLASMVIYLDRWLAFVNDFFAVSAKKSS